MGINQKVKKIVFLDTLSSVEEYLNKDRRAKANGTDEPNCLFVAINPAVHSYLKQRGFFVENTLPYFTNDSHAKALERSEILVDWLRENSEFADLGIGVQGAFKDIFIYWTRLLIHYNLWVIEIISNAVDTHRPEILAAASSKRKSVSSLLIEPEEKYLGLIVKIIAREKSLKYEDTSIDTAGNHEPSFSLLNIYIGPIIKYLFRYIRFLLWEKMNLGKKIFAKNRPILFTTTFYQMDEFVKEIRTRLSDKQLYFLQIPAIPHFRISDFIIKLIRRHNSKTIMAQKKLFKNLIITLRVKTKLFSYRDIPFAEIMAQKIQNNVVDYMVGLYLWAVKLDRFVNALRPCAIISNGNRADDLILAELCKKKEIPTVMIPHGSHVRPKNKYESIEWGENGIPFLRAPFSLLVLQSPLAEGYLDTFPSAGRVIRTGPLTWGKPVKLQKSRLLFNKMFNGRYEFGKVKVILHAGTPKRTKGLRFYVYETPDEYIQALCELANAIEKIPDAVLIIRFRPRHGLSLDDLKNFVPFSEKILLSVDEPFIDMLGMADLLVSFSSTTIEEALQNRIPVLFYGGGGRYQHIPAYEIESGNSIRPSAVYHVKETSNLENAICKILSLNMGIDGGGYLFEPYIYPQDVRTSLVDLLKSLPEEKGRCSYEAYARCF